MSPRNHAFTLIELLVVLTIISLLAAMLLPAVGLVRSSAQGVRCSSALNQLGIATLAYTNDWDSLLPRLKTPRQDNAFIPCHWFDTLAPMVGLSDDWTMTSFSSRWSNVIWGCPNWPKSAPTTNLYRPGYGYSWFPLAPTSYATNFCWLDPAGSFNNFGVDIPLGRIAQRGRRIMLGETLDWPLSTPAATATAFPASWDPTRHRGRANYVFFDNHIQTIAATGNAYLGSADPASTAWSP